MAGDVLRELLVAILTKFDESSNKQALDAVTKSQAEITEREKRGHAERAKGLTAALGAASKQVSAFTKTVLQAGEKVSLGLVTIAGAVEGAAVAGTFALARLSKEMSTAYYSGQKLGSAVKDMDAFRYASEQAGSSAAKAQAGLEELGHLRNTNPAAYVGLLQRLGVAAKDAAGNLRAPAQAAMDLAPALAKLPRQLQLLFGNQLGFDDDQTLAMTRPAFLAQLEQYKEMQRKIGFDPDKAAADGAKFQQIWTKMWNAVDIVSKKVQSAFFDQVGGSVDHITDMLVKNSGRITDLAIKVGDYVIHLATSIVDLVANFDKLSPATQRFIEILAALAAGLLVLRAGPIGALMALASALAFLWDDYEKYKQGLPSVVDWEKWEPQIKAAVDGLTKLWTKLDEISVKVTGQGGLQLAMEAFAVFMATTWVAKLVGAFATVSKAWAPLAALLTAAGYLANNTGSNVDPWADQSTGETALRAADPGLADRVYGKRGEQLPHGPRHGVGTHAAPHDDRNLWQRTMPKALGGKDAPEGAAPKLSPIERLRRAARGPEKGGDATHVDQAGSRAGRANVNMTPENAASIVSAAKELGTTPEDLATVIGYETAGTYSPSKWGGKGGDYLGLIQFGRPERRQYGADENQTFPQQMEAVKRYLKGRGFKPGMGLLDLYSTINAGSPGHYNASDGNGTVRSHVARMQVEHAPRARMFVAMASGGAAPAVPAVPTSAPIGDQAALDAQNRIVAGQARAGDAALIAEHRRQQNAPALYHPDDDRAGRSRGYDGPYGVRGHLSPVQYTHGGGANALTRLYTGGFGRHSQGAIALSNPLGTSPASMYRAYDSSRTTTLSPTVNQTVTINGVQDPHAIGQHLKHHAKRGVQDTLRNMQGPSN